MSRRDASRLTLWTVEKGQKVIIIMGSPLVVELRRAEREH